MRIKGFHVVVLCLLATIATSGCSEINNELKGARIAATVAEGDRQEDLGNMMKARSFYDDAIKLDPDSPLPYLGPDPDNNPEDGIMGSLAEREDWPTLDFYLTQAVADPKLASVWQIWQMLGETQDRLGQEAASRASYLKELDLLKSGTLYKGEVISGADEPGGPFDIADAEWGAGLQAKSRADFLALIAEDPNGDSAPIVENDLSYREADADMDLPEAYSLARKAVDYYNRQQITGEAYGEILDTMGWVEYKMGKDNDAARDIADALDNDPRESVIHMHMAVIDRALGDPTSAEIEIDRALELCPSDAQIRSAARIIDPQLLATTPAMS